ncbi:hypothetical protein JRQ81_004080 [Phrynocephalus forsythii]|uniref:EF-hand domain-containing protein n=1 Tax=Phrynocephalus forsythii TaxID=171643 RepID=A0A9Q0XN97_9SAUR|nr:hypothetical protein JRQ81_004080 [Phrynocephalus forsythii]
MEPSEAGKPPNLMQFLRKLKEVFDVCDEDADGFIRVEHFVALGLQFGQGDEVEKFAKYLDPNDLGKINFKDFCHGVFAIKGCEELLKDALSAESLGPQRYEPEYVDYYYHQSAVYFVPGPLYGWSEAGKTSGPLLFLLHNNNLSQCWHIILSSDFLPEADLVQSPTALPQLPEALLHKDIPRNLTPRFHLPVFEYKKLPDVQAQHRVYGQMRWRCTDTKGRKYVEQTLQHDFLDEEKVKSLRKHIP